MIPAPSASVVCYSLDKKARLKRSPPFDFFCRGVWEKSLVSQNGQRPALNPSGQASETAGVVPTCPQAETRRYVHTAPPAPP